VSILPKLYWVDFFKRVLKKYDVGNKIGISSFRCGDALIAFNKFCNEEQKKHNEDWKKNLEANENGKNEIRKENNLG